jgi:hypothetical protein
MITSAKNLLTSFITLSIATCAPLSAQGLVTDKYNTILKPLEEQAPLTYPEHAATAPSASELDKISDERLIALLGHWNPYLRASLVKNLATRSDTIVEKLRASTSYKDTQVREGVLQALKMILEKRLKDVATYAPGIENRNDARAKVISDMGVEEIFLKLSKDPSHKVRKHAVDGLIELGAISDAVTMAMLEATQDDNEFIAQNAMIQLEKKFTSQVLKQKGIHDYMSKGLEFELPRGRGHLLRIIMKMPKEDQLQLLPQIHQTFTWQPMRDTMFGGGGKSEALKIMADHQYKPVLPSLVKLFGTDFFGTNLNEPIYETFKAFGKDAKPYLEPMIKKRDTFIAPKDASNWAKNDLKKKYDAADKIVKHLESL